MKAVMYHYVRPPDPTGPRMRYLHIEDFRKQLDFFESRFRLPSLHEFLGLVEETNELPEDVVILTFDDGLSDHYHYVLPELIRRRTFGIFYVATSPLTSHRPLDVHRVHVLVGSIPAQHLLSQIGRIVTEDMLAPGAESVFADSTYTDQDDAREVIRVKRLLNYFIRDDWRTTVIDRLMIENGISMAVEDFYLTPSHLREMHAAGMLIGSHSVSHPVMSQLLPSRQLGEVKESFRFLDDLVDGLPIKTYCHPYGGDESFSPATEDILVREGCRFSFSIESRDVRRRDLLERPQALPRYDCNEFPNGKAR